MADSKYSEEIKFYKPKLRFIIPISNFHYPKKLFNEFKRTKYSFKIDQDFAKVIELCKEIKRKRLQKNYNSKQVYFRLS